MTPRKLVLLAAVWLALAPAAIAHDYQLAGLKIEHPWARPTVAGQSVGGAFLGIRNNGVAADRLLGGRTSAATTVEVHEMRMDGEVMRMREIGVLDLPVGRTVRLAPGSLHLMLIGLKAPLKVGDKVPLVLRFEKAGEIEVLLHVENKPSPMPMDHKH